MENKKPKNILHDVLYDMDAADKNAPQQVNILDSLIHRPFDQAQPSRQPQQETVCPSSPTRRKKRTTIYLSQQTSEQLVAAKGIIRDLLPEDASVRVSMSCIADNALQLILKELDVKRKDSILLKLMLRNCGNS